MAHDDSLKKYQEKWMGFEEKFGINFNNKYYLLEALNHTTTNSEKKKMYAAAGDALLDFILYDFLLDKGGYTKSRMDHIRQMLNNDSTLARIGKRIGLKEFIIFPSSATRYDRETGDAYYTDTLEALVYVIMKDQCLESTKEFITKYIHHEIPEN